MAEENTNTPVIEVTEASEKNREDTLNDAFSVEALRLQLEQFEGPFEVLLYLIKEQEIDIFDIPIVQVTQQYLQFLDLLQTEHLDMAGDFLVMAATLIQIKSRMILPVEMEQDDDEEEVEEEDPRLELVGKLLEYRRFRDFARLLGAREENWSNIFTRRVKLSFEPADDDEEELIDVSLYDLMKSVRGMIRFLMGEVSHHVQLEGASVDEKIAQIESLLEERESVSWSDLCRMGANRIELVCSLLAILELCRMQRIRVRQHGAFGEIRLFAHVADNTDPRENDHEASPALS
jgi:segregation and condensation protein A